MGALTGCSLFAGIGGFDLAMGRAGISVRAAVEIDTACRGVLARRFPGTALLGDVGEVSAGDLRAAGFVPGRGIVCAGWPCQGNSVAGRRGGLADARTGLWGHVVRLLAATRARWFVGENVPGLFEVNDGADFGRVLADLDALGYGVAWRVLDAQWFGVPQRRRRVFLVGCLGDGTAPVAVLLEPEGGVGHSAPGRTPGARPAGGPDGGADGAGGQRDIAYPVTAHDAKGSDGTASSGVILAPAPVSTLQGGGRRGYRVDAEGAAGGQLVVQPLALRGREGGTMLEAGAPGDPMFTVRARSGSCSYPMIAAARRLAHTLTAEGADASEDGSGRGTPLAVSGQVVRRLTPLECERLQGFPDGWTAGQSDTARYRQLGNAVAVPVAEWVLARLAAYEQGGGAPWR